MHIAASSGASIELVKLLLDFGADPNITNQGSNALMLARSSNHTHLIELLRNPPPQTRWGEKRAKPRGKSKSPFGTPKSSKTNSPSGTGRPRGASSASEDRFQASPIEDDTPRRRSFVGNAIRRVSFTLAAALRGTSPSAGREYQHLMFFSYAQQDCASETLHLAEKAASKFKGSSIFRDADVKFKLDELVEHVRRSKNVIVLLSGQYAHRPFTLVELHTALLSGANVVAVKVLNGSKPFDFKQVANDIESGKLADYLDAKGWKLLEEYGIDKEAVAKDLKAVMNVRAADFTMGLATKVVAAMVEDIFEGVII